MSLTTRLLLFSQASLAVILVIFCVTLYVSARWYADLQAEGSAQRALDTLVASVDIEPDSVEWEPSDRELSLGIGPLGGNVYWFITDAEGHAVDRSKARGTADLIAAAGMGADAAPAIEGWVVSRKLVHPPGASGPQLTRARTDEEIEKGEYPAFVFTTGVRTGPLRTALQKLSIGLAAVSLVVWFAALAVGRFVCRRALRPLTDMAGAARDMDAEDAHSRIPPAGVRGELEDLHAAISGLLDRLRSALARERQFTAEASHQLRTPLGAILGQVDVALRRPRSTAEYERVLDVVRRQGNALARSIEALLFLARSDSDAPPPATQPIDLGPWAEEFLASLGAHPRRSDLVIDRADGPLWIDAHPTLLREMVGNLVDNALKYSPPGTPVTIRLTRDAGGVGLAVEDRGAGVLAADLPHIFEPFFRSKEAGRAGVPGSGLGLAVVARIAAAFQGRIVVENRPGGGVCFTVVLPRREDKADFIPPSPSF